MSLALRPRTLSYWVVVAVLVLVLFWVGADSNRILDFLTQGWVASLRFFGLHTLAGKLQLGTSTELTKRSLLAVATYAVGYLALCLLLLRLLLPSVRDWGTVVRLYAATIGLLVLLMVLGRLSGVLFFYKAGRRLIDFIVSPLPVMLLLALFSPAIRRLGARK